MREMTANDAGIPAVGDLAAAMAFFMPPLGSTDEDGVSQDQQLLLQQYLNAAAEKEMEEKQTEQVAENQADNKEITRYDLSEDASTETAMIFGEVYRSGAEWKFRAVGQGYSTGLAGIARDYGARIENLRPG